MPPVSSQTSNWVAIAALTPLALWLAFILWRGFVLPPLSHDALAYHLPKAVMILRAKGYQFFDVPDPRIASSPANYELLLSSILALDGSDRVTEWLSTLAFVYLLLLSAAQAERWWGRGLHVVASMLLVAGLPIALLQSGADKNDLLASAFYLAAFLWAARWHTSPSRVSAAHVVIALALGAGTKVQGAFPCAVVAAMAGASGLRRLRAGTRPSLRDLSIVVGIAAAAFVLLGGTVYVGNLKHFGSPFGSPAMAQQQVGYGDYGNLWAFPYLLLTVPFSSNPQAVWVPWRHEYWFWPRYEIYFSHYGAPLTLLVVALPIAVWRYRKRSSENERAERAFASIAVLATFALLLPTKIRPLGFFAGFPRYLLFAVPVAVNWTLVPLLRELFASPAATRKAAAYALLAGCDAILLVHGVVYAQSDTFAPLSYALEMAEHPGSRHVHFATRASNMVDEIAAPNDAIAVDASFDTWLMPLYGAHLTRPVVFVPPGPGPVSIPPEVKWVVVDRSWNAIWGHPDFMDMGQFMRYLGRGRPSEEDLRVVRALSRDPRFKLLGYRRGDNQALFERVTDPSARVGAD
jgi:hypothetical protein